MESSGLMCALLRVRIGTFQAGKKPGSLQQGDSPVSKRKGPDGWDTRKTPTGSGSVHLFEVKRLRRRRRMLRSAGWVYIAIFICTVPVVKKVRLVFDEDLVAMVHVKGVESLSPF